jgi:ATP/maltotriose-dependent transcriptional regulator MalT
VVWFPETAAALGAVYILDGRIADAVGLLTPAMEQTTAMESVEGQVQCHLTLGEAQALAGRLEEAYSLAGHALALTRQHQERGNQAYALRLLGEIAARRDPPQRSSRLEPITSTPSRWPTNSACARSRATATWGSARCMPSSAARS